MKQASPTDRGDNSPSWRDRPARYVAFARGTGTPSDPPLNQGL
jgi:hypothetical protein